MFLILKEHLFLTFLHINLYNLTNKLRYVMCMKELMFRVEARENAKTVGDMINQVLTENN